MCGIVPLMLLQIFLLVANCMPIFGKDSTKPFFTCIYATKKYSFGFAIFKIGALVNKSFKCRKLSSHLAIHSKFIPLFCKEVIGCAILEKLVIISCSNHVDP
jgi:hypothetical protein